MVFFPTAATPFRVAQLFCKIICSVSRPGGNCSMNIAMDDHELLREFVHRRSEDAFSRLVERHLRMVLSTARRLLGDDQLAQDVTQNVFTLFAQKARGIKPPQVVGGWLYNTARHVAMHAMRGERRRREREQAAAAL